MSARRIPGTNLPPMLGLHSIFDDLFTLAQEYEGERFYAIRMEAPIFVIEGKTPDEVVALANQTLRNFLSKMHRYGFRS